MAVIDDIETINDRISEWLIHTTPSTADATETEKMKRVVALHNQLDQLLARAQLLDLQQQNKALALLLAKQGAYVSELTSQIKETSNGIEKVETVISVAAQAIAVIVQIVAFVP